MHENLIVGVIYRCQNNSRSIPYILDMFLCISVCRLEYWKLGFHSLECPTEQKPFCIFDGNETKFVRLDKYGDWSL